ncbi:MAG: very short patch repair endonuclease [Candidatus Helarchaeota archaeon]|nr:very short patch repair endonuclease [Candidatus Helarchaeota archaeon]
MADIHSKTQRSFNMSRIRSRGNKSTEIRMIQLFREAKIKGWRRHLDLPGKPDFTFQRERLVLFIDGCFWHRCPMCKFIPTSNIDYWKKKLAYNVARDRKANEELRNKGWQVLRFWEHSLKKPKRVVSRIRKALLENKQLPSYIPLDEASTTEEKTSKIT